MSTIENFFKYWDAYPMPITLRYNSGRGFATAQSGCMSIIGNLMVCYWVVTTFLETYQAGYDHKVIVVLDPTVGKNAGRRTDMLRSQFDFMVKIASHNSTLNLQSTKYIVPTVMNRIWDKNTSSFQMESYQMYPCSNFINMTNIKVVDELSSSHDMEFLCIRDEDHWKLELDHIRSRLFVAIDICPTYVQKHDFMAYKGQCATDEEIKENLHQFDVKVIMKHQIFDLNNYHHSHNETEMFTKDLQAFYTGPSQSMDLNRLVRDSYTLKKTIITMDDNWILQSILWKPSKKIHFYNPMYLDQDVRSNKRNITFDPQDPGKTSIYTVEMMRDPRIEKQTYSIKNIGKFFAMFGGFIGLIQRIVATIRKQFDAFNLDSSMADKLYTAKKKGGHKVAERDNEREDKHLAKVRDEVRRNVENRESIRPTWCSWYMHAGCCGCSRKGSRTDLLFKDAQKKLMSELDILKMVKMMRLNRTWMNKHKTRRQRELNHYFDEYTLHQGEGGDSSNNESPPDDGIPPGERNDRAFSEQKLLGTKVGYIGLKTKKLIEFQAADRFTAEQQDVIFDLNPQEEGDRQVASNILTDRYGRELLDQAVRQERINEDHNERNGQLGLVNRGENMVINREQQQYQNVVHTNIQEQQYYDTSGQLLVVKKEN